jgi:hypothetical protein
MRQNTRQDHQKTNDTTTQTNEVSRLNTRHDKIGQGKTKHKTQTKTDKTRQFTITRQDHHKTRQDKTIKRQDNHKTRHNKTSKIRQDNHKKRQDKDQP